MGKLSICGKTLALSPADVLLPAMCGLVIHSIFFAVLCVLWRSFLKAECFTRGEEIWIGSALVVHFCEVLNDIILFVLVARLRVGTRGTCIRIFWHTRLLLWFAEFALLLFGTVLLSVDPICAGVDSDRYSERTILRVGVAANWFVCLVGFVFVMCTYSRSDRELHAKVARSLGCLVCRCCWKEEEMNQFDPNEVLLQFGKLFEWFHKGLSPTEYFIGLNLLSIMQKHHYSMGKQFAVADCIGEEADDRGISSNQLNSRCGEFKEPLHRRMSGADPMKQAMSYGIQPKMSENDMKRVLKLKHYCKFMVGAYGAPLYLFDNLLSCGFCKLCCCLASDTNRDQDEITYGNRCGFGKYSIRAFLHKTGINPEDLLYANQLVGLSKIANFVAVDREEKKLVIACRGTQSVQDSVTDIWLKPVEFNELGFDGCYAHEGILRAAKTMLEQIKSRPKIRKFLEANQDYDTVICGHSLGAGVAIVISLLFRTDQYKDWRFSECFTYGCPAVVHLTDEATKALDPMRYITECNNGHDIISRISIHSLFKMSIAFEMLLNSCNSRYNKIFRGAMRGQRYDPGRIRWKEGSMAPKWMDDWELFDSLLEQEWEKSLLEIPELQEFGHVQFNHVGRAFITLAHRSKDRCSCCSYCPSLNFYKNKKIIIIPVDNKRSFNEILSSQRMWLDHFPNSSEKVLGLLDIGLPNQGRLSSRRGEAAEELLVSSQSVKQSIDVLTV